MDVLSVVVEKLFKTFILSKPHSHVPVSMAFFENIEFVPANFTEVRSFVVMNACFQFVVCFFLEVLPHI